MNMLVIGKFSKDQFGFHIADTFRDMGYAIIEFEPTLKYRYYNTVIMRRLHQVNHVISNSLINISVFRKSRKKRLDKIFTENKIDLTITTYDFLFPDEVDYIKKRSKAPVALWFPDAVSNFGKAMFVISSYDFLFFKDPYIVDTLRNEYNLKNVFYLPECCNPKYHKKIKVSIEEKKFYGSDLATVGNMHSLRMKLFMQLNGYDVKIWGNPPPVWINNNIIESMFQKKYVFNEEKAKVYASSKIVVNNLYPSEIWGINNRAFEIPACGGFQLINYRQGLNQLLKDGEDVVSFKSFYDLKEKIDFYLKNESDRNKIANAGNRKVLSEHTYVLRLKLLIDTVFNNGKGFPIFKIDF